MGQSVGDYSNGYGGATGTYQASGQQGGSDQNGEETWQQTFARYQAEIKDLTSKLGQASAGFEREKLEAQREDAQKALDNAYRIAQLQSETQKYGYDQTRQTEIDQLKEKQREYDSDHKLEQQKYGLDVAKAYTSYASTPDQTWLLNDFKGALSRVGQGLGAQSSATESDAHAKTWEDFAALSGYDNLDTVKSGTTGSTGSGSTGQYTTSANGGAATSDGQQTTTDARNTAINAVTKAIPASDSEGHDDQDWAALNAIKSLYFAGKPGSVERLGKARQKIANAGLARLGYSSDQVNEDYQRAGVGQGSSRAA